MGLMSDPTSGAQLILTPHPVSLEGQRHLGAALQPGENLGPYLRRTVPDWHGDAWEVRINGVLVPVEVLDRVRPKDGALIEVRGIVKKQVLYVVAFALLTWWTMGAFAAAGAAGGTVFGLSGMAAYAATAAVYVGGSMLINKVLGPKPPAPGSAQAANPVYSINSARNTPRPYEPLPLLFGTVRITPDIASMPYVWFEGNDQIMGMVLTPGLNVHSIEALYNGETPLASFEGVQTFLNGFAGHADQTIPLYSNADSLAGGELEAGGAWVQRTSSPDTVRLQLDFEGVLYDIDGKGRFAPNTVAISVQYRAVGETEWQAGATLSIYNRSADNIRRTVTLNVPQGQYEVRAQLGLPRWNEGTPHDDCRFTWTVLKSIQPDEADYTGIPRIGIRIKATGQLNGALDEVRCVAHSMPLPVWNGTSWVLQHTSNPGAQLLAYARGIYALDEFGDPVLLAGIGLPDSQIDIPALQAFMVHCADNGYTYDAYIKDGRTHQEMVEAIALAGFGQTTWAGGRFSVVWASADQPLTGVVNMATIKRGSFQVDYTLANAADGIEYTYVDGETWTTATLRVPAPGVETMHNPARITGEGITSEAHAARMARYHLAQSLYQSKDISYSTDLEHLTYRRMSVLALSHDMTQWGYGGRLRGATLSGSTLTVTLDEPVPFLSTPYIGLRVPGEVTYRVFPVQAFAGESDTLTLAEPWPAGVPAPGVGEGNPAHDTIWIYDIKATPGYRVRVVQIEPESDLQGAGIVVVPESPEFWTYVHTGEYIPPANQSLLQGRPIASGVVVTEQQVVQGDTVFTQLSVVFDITGRMAYATVEIAEWLEDAWGEFEQVAETRTTAARFRVPRAGAYTITVRPYAEDGTVGIPATVQYATEGADIPPPPFDVFNVIAVPGGLRKYTWSYLPGTMQAPDFAGAEIRYIAGEVAEPEWDDMTPVGDEGYHPAAFESSVPVAGTWTFAARARNTSGELSAPIVITRTLTDNLGEVIDGIGEDIDEVTQAQVDAQMALDQEIADRIAADLATATAAAADATAKANAALASAMAAVSALEAQLADITGAPEWDIAETYDPDQLVKYDGALYRARVQTTGDQPDISPTEWEKVGDYASLGEAVAAALSMATTTADELAAQVTRIDAITARMPAGTGDLATEALVASEVSALASDIAAEAGRVDAIVARMPAGSGALATQASVSSEATTRATADTALSNRVGVVEARMPSGSGELATAAALSSLSGTVSTQGGQITASAERIDSVVARLSSVQPVINGGFEAVSDGWAGSEGGANAGTFALPDGFAISAASGVPASGARGLRILTSATANRTLWNFALTPVVPGETVFGRYMGRITTASGALPPAGLVFRIALRWYDAAGAYTGVQHWVAEMTVGTAAIPYQAFTGSAVAPSTAAFVRVIAQVVGTQTAGQLLVDDVAIERRGPAAEATAQALTATQATVTSQGGTLTSHASRLTSVEATAGSHSASIATLNSVTASTDNRLRAVNTVSLNVNGHVSGTVSENDGTRSSFSILATVFRVISTATGMGMEWQDGYLRIWRGSAQLVIGHSFGSGNLVFWYGPNVGAGNCTKANGTIWFDTAGSAYFGGSLSAGVLYNSAQSSTIGTAAVAQVGPFGTNGNSKSVVSSFSYDSNAGRLTGNQSALNGQAVSATVVVERSTNNGASWTQIATYTATGTISAVYDGGQGWTNVMYPDFGGSTTTTDTNSSTNDFMYRARITGSSGSWPMTFHNGQGTQRLTIASTEQ